MANLSDKQKSSEAEGDIWMEMQILKIAVSPLANQIMLQLVA